MPMQMEAYPFAGDTLVGDEFKRLIKKFGIKTVFETGTYQGVTTAYLAAFVPRVETAELNRKYFAMARGRLAPFKNVNMHLGNSPQIMDQRIPYSPQPILFFLDAHWGPQWPVLAELNVIAKHKLTKSVIVIHDFKVPGKNFGFDSFKKVALDWGYISQHIDKIYGRGNYEVHYNTEALGAKRGVIYVTPLTRHPSIRPPINHQR